MLDKALFIILCIYSISIAYITVEWAVVDVMHLTVENYRGEELSASLIGGFMNIDLFNSQTDLIINGTFNQNTTPYNRVETSITAAAAVAWNLIILLSGTAIFTLLYFLGVPLPFVLGLAVIYIFLLARAIFGYLNRI